MCKALEDISNEREFLTFRDIMKLHCCGEGLARKTIREIRNFCGYSPLPRGKVFIVEYIAWRDRGRTAI